jgi:transposase-like protein
MKNYQKIMRRVISHPKSAIEIPRKFTNRHRKCCVKCGSIGHLHIHSTDQRGLHKFEFQACKKIFSETYGTIFYRFKIPISYWLLAIIYWADATGSISSADLSRKLGISHPTAWKMLMKMRKNLSIKAERQVLKGIVEADEAWFGKNQNHEIILGLVERINRKLVLVVVPNVKEKTLFPYIKNYVETGSLFCTDSRVSYAATGIRYRHYTTNHSKGEYARGIVHSNTIEQIWGDIKGIIRTIHHGVSKKYRKLYLSQYIFAYQFKKSTNFFFKTLFHIFSPTYCLI